MVDPADDIIQFDVRGHSTGNFTHHPYLQRVGDRNEADPEKWLVGDPFGPAIPPFDERDLQTVRPWLKEAELSVQVDYGRSGGAGDSYLVRDYHSFEDLVLNKREPAPRGLASVFDVYRGPHFTLRGIVDESFIARTEAEFPEPYNLWIIDPRSVYPEEIGLHELADSVQELSTVLRGLIGEYVAVGLYRATRKTKSGTLTILGRRIGIATFSPAGRGTAVRFADSRKLASQRSDSRSIPTSTARSNRSSSQTTGSGEGATLRVAPELADPVGPLKVRERQDVEHGAAPKRSDSGTAHGLQLHQPSSRHVIDWM
jgi:hypothetical protein